MANDGRLNIITYNLEHGDSLSFATLTLALKHQSSVPGTSLGALYPE